MGPLYRGSRALWQWIVWDRLVNKTIELVEVKSENLHSRFPPPEYRKRNEAILNSLPYATGFGLFSLMQIQDLLQTDLRVKNCLDLPNADPGIFFRQICV